MENNKRKERGKKWGRSKIVAKKAERMTEEMGLTGILRLFCEVYLKVFCEASEAVL